jgi:hypothetical protein
MCTSGLPVMSGSPHEQAPMLPVNERRLFRSAALHHVKCVIVRCDTVIVIIGTIIAVIRNSTIIAVIPVDTSIAVIPVDTTIDTIITVDTIISVDTVGSVSISRQTAYQLLTLVFIACSVSMVFGRAGFLDCSVSKVSQTLYHLALSSSSNTEAATHRCQNTYSKPQKRDSVRDIHTR